MFSLEKQAGVLVKDSKNIRKGIEIVSSKVHTRAERKAFLTDVNRSAITDHVAGAIMSSTGMQPK